MFESDDMVKRFLASGRTGFYFAVRREGEVGAGDEIKVIAREPNGIPVSGITRLYVAKRYGDADVSWVQRALRVAVLPESWTEYFRQRLERIPIETDQPAAGKPEVSSGAVVSCVRPHQREQRDRDAD